MERKSGNDGTGLAVTLSEQRKTRGVVKNEGTERRRRVQSYRRVSEFISASGSFQQTCLEIFQETRKH